MSVQSSTFFPFWWPNNRSFSSVLPPLLPTTSKVGAMATLPSVRSMIPHSYTATFFLFFSHGHPYWSYLLLPMKRRATFSLTDINLSRILLPWSFSPFTDVILKGRIHMRCMHKEKHIWLVCKASQCLFKPSTTSKYGDSFLNFLLRFFPFSGRKLAFLCSRKTQDAKRIAYWIFNQVLRRRHTLCFWILIIRSIFGML